jgi:fructose-bisphosphate aldolase class II
VDALAVSIGEVTGFYEEEPELDFDRLRRIRERTDAFLVLHGASGLSPDLLEQAIERGINYVAYATDVRFAYFQRIGEILQSGGPRMVDPREILIPAQEAAKEVIKEKLRINCCHGQADAMLRRWAESTWFR